MKQIGFGIAIALILIVLRYGDRLMDVFETLANKGQEINTLRRNPAWDVKSGEGNRTCWEYVGREEIKWCEIDTTDYIKE